MTFKLQSTL